VYRDGFYSTYSFVFYEGFKLHIIIGWVTDCMRGVPHSESDPPLAPPQLHPQVRIQSLLAPRTNTATVTMPNSRPQNGSPQTSGWLCNSYVHYFIHFFKMFFYGFKLLLKLQRMHFGVFVSVNNFYYSVCRDEKLMSNVYETVVFHFTLMDLAIFWMLSSCTLLQSVEIRTSLNTTLSRTT